MPNLEVSCPDCGSNCLGAEGVEYYNYDVGVRTFNDRKYLDIHESDCRDTEQTRFFCCECGVDIADNQQDFINRVTKSNSNIKHPTLIPNTETNA